MTRLNKRLRELLVSRAKEELKSSGLARLRLDEAQDVLETYRSCFNEQELRWLEQAPRTLWDRLELRRPATFVKRVEGRQGSSNSYESWVGHYSDPVSLGEVPIFVPAILPAEKFEELERRSLSRIDEGMAERHKLNAELSRVEHRIQQSNTFEQLKQAWPEGAYICDALLKEKE